MSSIDLTSMLAVSLVGLRADRSGSIVSQLLDLADAVLEAGYEYVRIGNRCRVGADPDVKFVDIAE